MGKTSFGVDTPSLAGFALPVKGSEAQAAAAFKQKPQGGKWLPGPALLFLRQSLRKWDTVGCFHKIVLLYVIWHDRIIGNRQKTGSIR